MRRRSADEEAESHVVVDGWARLPRRFHDVEYARTPQDAVDLLRRRHAQGRVVTDLWLSWELLDG